MRRQLSLPEQAEAARLGLGEVEAGLLARRQAGDIDGLGHAEELRVARQEAVALAEAARILAERGDA